MDSTEKRPEKHSIFVAGAGGIGKAVALLLREMADFEVDIYLGDVKLEAAQDTCDWLTKGSSRGGIVEAIPMPESETDDALNSALEKCEVILDCLPGSQAPRIARLARQHNCHYANLTEYVSETEDIIKIAEGAERGFILQTGLAPGFINILACSLFNGCCSKWEVDEVDYISMKVGALSRNALPPHYYAFTWSEVGVATEYLKPAIVIRDFQKQEAPSLSERATIVIDGITYEEDLTSGGAANLPVSFARKTKKLDYKTLRHVGHYEWINGLLNALPGDYRTPGVLQAMMQETVPRVEDDFVLIYASVQGRDKDGKLQVREETRNIKPKKIGEKMLRAIQATTAASLAECAVMLLKGKYKGVVLQSQIDPDEFLRGTFVSYVYGA